jgi:hypothetical protein
MAVVAAAIRAVAHLIPDILPFLAPLKGSSADRADLGGPISVMGHLKRQPSWAMIHGSDTNRNTMTLVIERVLDGSAFFLD